MLPKGILGAALDDLKSNSFQPMNLLPRQMLWSGFCQTRRATGVQELSKEAPVPTCARPK